MSLLLLSLAVHLYKDFELRNWVWVTLFTGVVQKGENENFWNILKHNRLHCCEGGDTAAAGESPIGLSGLWISHVIYILV